MMGKTSRQRHGASKLPEYRTWINMRQRCNYSKGKDFKHYGARGIKVCERWDVFENFLKDMGPRPSKLHSIDRINNELGYSPDNCRWATMTDQNNNRRKGKPTNDWQRENRSGVRGVEELPSGNFRARYADQTIGTFGTLSEAYYAYLKFTGEIKKI